MGNSTVLVLNCLLWYCVSAALIGTVDGIKCDIKTSTSYRTVICPTKYDEPDQLFCCGTGDEQHCCNGEESRIDGSGFAQSIIQIIAFIVIMLIITFMITCCCCCCQGCLLYKYRERRRAAVIITMIPMQPMASVPSTDAAGRPLYYTQQYYPVVHQGYPQMQYPVESVPLAANPNYTESSYGANSSKQGISTPNQNYNQPFTYGPVTKTAERLE